MPAALLDRLLRDHQLRVVSTLCETSHCTPYAITVIHIDGDVAVAVWAPWFRGADPEELQRRLDAHRAEVQAVLARLESEWAALGRAGGLLAAAGALWAGGVTAVAAVQTGEWAALAAVFDWWGVPAAGFAALGLGARSGLGWWMRRRVAALA